MERDRAENEGLEQLVEDVLSTEPLEPELLVRYAEDPRSLNAAERAQVRALLESSPGAADQVRVLRNFDPAAAAADSAAPVAAALGRLSAPVRDGWAWVRWLSEHPGGLVAAAVAAALAIAFLYGIVPVPGGGPERGAPSGSDRFAGVEPVPETRALPAPPDVEEPSPTIPAERIAVVEDSPAPIPPERRAIAEDPVKVAETPPEASTPPALEPEIQIAMLDLPALPAYVAPVDALEGFGFGRTSPILRSAGPPLPRVTALVPEHAGRTIQASPSLYWSLSSSTDRPLVVTLRDIEREQTLFSVALPGPHAKGVAGLDLADHGARLAVGRTYRWFVSVLAGDAPGGGDSVAGGGIVRSTARKELEQILAAAGPERTAHVYAKHGLWYDALDAASDRIAHAPQDVSGREQRTALLAAVGLD
jgi:hypothetical protein